MSIRLDPRRLSTLRALAGDAGLRPGELVQRWVEERLDSSRAPAGGELAAPIVDAGALAALAARVDALSARLDAMSPTATAESVAQEVDEPEVAVTDAPLPVVEPRRRGRPRKVVAVAEVGAPAVPAKRAAKARAGRAVGRARSAKKSAAKGAAKVALHHEMMAIITERGPQTAAQLAAAITERGKYAPPRSGKPLDAATVSGRVSNPTYRARFVRDGRRIGLATT